MTKNAPAGFHKIETSIAGFWKPTKEGQTIQGSIMEAIQIKGRDGDNTFYTLCLTSEEGGPILSSDDKPVKPEEGMIVGVGGKMLLPFLRGREGREVFLVYAGLGKKKSGQSAPKMYETYERSAK